MNILILNGSMRKNGATAIILKLVNELFESRGAVVEFINVADLDFNRCTGCSSCYSRGDCIFEDDAKTIANKMLLADGIIVGSPTYMSNISGSLKLLLDRSQLIMEQALKNKYFVSVVVGENHGARKASEILSGIFMYAGAYRCATIVLNNKFNSNPLNNESLKKSIISKTNKMYYAIKGNKKYLFQNIKNMLIFKVGIKSYVYKNRDNYKGLIDKWEENNII